MAELKGAAGVVIVLNFCRIGNGDSTHVDMRLCE
jgi:hypothetical protein